MGENVGCCLVCTKCGYRVQSPLLTDTIVAICTYCQKGIMLPIICTDCSFSPCTLNFSATPPILMRKKFTDVIEKLCENVP